VWMNKYVCVCVFVVMNLCVCEVVFSGYVCVWMVVYLCVYMCVVMRVCVCVCLFVFVWVWM